MRKTANWFVLGVLLAACIVSPAAFATEPAPLTGGAVTTVSGIALGSTTPITVIPADGARKFLQVQNITAATNTMACTIDGSTPVVNQNGLQMGPSGSPITFDTFVPTGAIKCLGSATSTAYTVNYVP